MSHATVRDVEPAGRPGDRPAAFDAPHLVTELPGPKARAHIAFDERVTSPSLPRAYPIVPVRGRGSVIEDIDGNRFLDFCAGIAVNVTGHCHPRVVDGDPAPGRGAPPLQRLGLLPADLRPPRGRAAADRADARARPASSWATPGPRSWRRRSSSRGTRPGVQYIVGFLGGFHGRTYGSVSLTASKAKYHARFGPLLPGIYHVPFGSAGLDELEQRIFHRLVPANEVAAIVVEPIQGEGGIVVPDDDFLPRLRRICDEHGILLVADEVQTGMGRTGRMWAIQHWDVEPDIILTAKGLASGMPIGALIAKEHLMTWAAGAHGSTFGGNPVSCAAALATIRPARGGPDRQRDRPGRADAGRRSGRSWGHTRASSGTCAARASSSASSSTRDATAAAVEHAAFERGLMVLTAGDDVSPDVAAARR